MIDLEKSYIAAADEGPVYFYLDFECETCGHRYNSFNLNLSVFLYGIAILAGPNCSYVGFTCLSCLKTNLLKSNNLERLRQDLDFFMASNGSQVVPDLRYHSQVLFPPEQIPELNDFNIVSCEYPLSDKGYKNFINQFNSYLVDDPLLESEYVCSYINNGELPIGTMATILWFKPEQIEALVEIENDHQIRVFPRYIHKMSWYERYDSFCWHYKLYQDYLAGLKITASETFTQLREHARKNDINLDNLIDANSDIPKAWSIEISNNQAQQNVANDVTAADEFLDLLSNYDPDPWDVPCPLSDLYKKMWKTLKPFRGSFDKATADEFDPGKFNPKITDTQFNEIVNDIRPHVSKSHVQQWANENYLNFINDYILLANRSDFSYGYVWELKRRYLQRLHSILVEAITEEAQYVFVKEGNEWLIKFEGKPIRGLRNKGFQYIYYLVAKNVAKNGKKTDVFSLGSLCGDSKSSTVSFEKDKSDDSEYEKKDPKSEHVDDMADDKTKALYDKLIEEKKQEKYDAKKNGFMKLYNEADEQYKLLKKEYNKLFRKGDTRKFDDGTHKDRKRIAKAIERAIDEVRGSKPLDRNPSREKVWLHFNEALRPISLYKISYSPKEDIDWFLG